MTAASDDDLAAVDRIVGRLQRLYAGWGSATSVSTMRSEWDDFLGGVPDKAEHEPFAIGDLPAVRIVAPNADPGRAVLYFHGGGFRVGSLRSHRGLMARLSAACGCAVVGIGYRLAPEHRFPAPVEDALSAYRWALAEYGSAERLALAGDSAGGGLALSCLLAARSARLPIPACAFLMSPWTDMTASGESYRSRAEADPIHGRDMILAMARGYLGRGSDPTDPLASPLLGDLAGLPPLLVQVGDRETVLDDARMLVEHARAAGTLATLSVADGMIHVFQAYPELASARAAIADGGRFIQDHLADTGSAPG